jgi:steroid delta-isomerase-like uncharacterized protein
MQTVQNIEIVRRAFHAVNARTFPSVASEVLAQDVIRHDLTCTFPEARGPGAVADLLQTLFIALPDFHVEIEDIFGDHDRVAVRSKVRGTHQGDLFGVPATGCKIEVSMVNIYRLMNARITETWQLLDIWSLMRQIRGE